MGSTTFANLVNAYPEANLIYVLDAAFGSVPCTGGGTGAMASYVNGSWACGARIEESGAQSGAQ